MNQVNPTTSAEESRKFPVKSLLIALVILAAAVAILIFKVSVGNVFFYGLFGFMLFSHFFMHSGHGAHTDPGKGASPSDQNGGHIHSSPDSEQINRLNRADGPDPAGNPETKSEKDPNSHEGHSGCC